jgi:SAM-dependent methyltransferase
MSSFTPHIHIEIHGNACQYFGSAWNEHAEEAAHLLLPDGLGEVVHIKPEITFNNNRTTKNGRKAPDGIEIRFGTARPTEPIRQVLRDHGYQFSEKQTMWYAYDNEKSRALADRWMNEEVEVDNTQYVKQQFWARVRSQEEYNQLREYTEFFLKTEPPKNYYGKRQLENSHYPLAKMMREGLLFFKKHFNRAVEEEDDPATPYDSAAVAQRLKDLAQSMDKAIDEKINSATSKQPPTPKRMRVASGMREEGRALQEVQNTLFALADAHLHNEIDNYPLLQSIRTKRQVELILRNGRYVKNGWDLSSSFESSKEELARLGIDSIEQWGNAAAEYALLMTTHLDTALAKEREKQDKIKKLEADVFRQNIPGFYPTPPDLISRVLELADLNATDTVLDPSAGKGDILDAVAALFPGQRSALYAAEINSTLREILRLKGYSLLGDDFLELTPDTTTFDRILMNPPFENGQDADHVTHALKFLRPGGRLVAIVIEGVFFRKFKKETVFRELLTKMNAYVSEPIDEGFKNAFNRASIRCRIIAINEDGTTVTTQHTPLPAVEPEPVTPAQSDEIALLELEAEAELELLKLRLELERKRTGQSLQGISLHKLQQYRQKAWALQNDTAVLDFK